MAKPYNAKVSLIHVDVNYSDLYTGLIDVNLGDEKAHQTVRNILEQYAVPDEFSEPEQHEDSLITRINLILKDEKDTTARLRLIVLLLLGFGERNPGLTRILTGHALMFEQDRLQGRINQLFERIEAQLRQVLREKRMREGEGYTTDETLLASQILAFCEGMLSRFVRSEFKYRPTDDFDARWPLIAAQLQ